MNFVKKANHAAFQHAYSSQFDRFVSMLTIHTHPEAGIFKLPYQQQILNYVNDSSTIATVICSAQAEWPGHWPCGDCARRQAEAENRLAGGLPAFDDCRGHGGFPSDPC